MSACVGDTKKKRGHLPDTGIRRAVPVPVSDTDTTPKMACPCNLGHRTQKVHQLSWCGSGIESQIRIDRKELEVKFRFIFF